MTKQIKKEKRLKKIDNSWAMTLCYYSTFVMIAIGGIVAAVASVYIDYRLFQTQWYLLLMMIPFQAAMVGFFGYILSVDLETGVQS